MLTLVPDSIEAYATAHSTKVPPLMEELRDFTLKHTDLPQMQVGPIEGNFLKMLAKICSAKRIVEVGTFTGYSSLMMASGLPDDGELYTCELDPRHAQIAQSFFDKSPHGNKIKILLGPAAESLRTLQAPFDMAFIDADKQGYIEYFDLIRPLMRPGGLIIADNVLWSGRVLEDAQSASPATQAIQAFNQYIQEQADLDHLMVTVRDGMTLILT